MRGRGEHHLRVAVLLTGDWHEAEDLVQASLVKLYRAWPRLDGDPDRYQHTCTPEADPARHLEEASCSNGFGAYLRIGDYEYTYIPDPIGGREHGTRSPQAQGRGSRSAAPLTWTSKDKPGAWSSRAA